MTKAQAIALASALAPCNSRWEAFHTGGNHWIVRLVRADGSMVVFSDEWALEYDSEADWADGNTSAELTLTDYAV